MRRYRIPLMVLAVLLAGAGFYGWRMWRGIFGPGPSLTTDRIVLIPTGAGFEQVVDSMRAAGVIADVRLFRMLAERKKYRGRVKPGRYRIKPGTSLNELVNKLRSGEQDPVRITFTNIRTLPQLSGRIASCIEVDSLAVLNAIRDPATAQRFGFQEGTIIAMFVPNTYEVWWTVSPEDLLARMAQEYKRFWNDGRKAKAAARGLSQTDVSVLASIVQAETAKPDEAPMVASVYLNRLRIGMPLQADPTLKFALGLDSLSRILTTDLTVDSPYNTYAHTGLPPGPINMPEPRYIDAVLNAPESGYLYFCAREDLSGYSNFAKTYEQHLVNARRYQHALNERRIFR